MTLNSRLELTERETQVVLEEATRAKNNRFCELRLVWHNGVLSGGDLISKIDKGELKRRLDGDLDTFPQKGV